MLRDRGLRYWLPSYFMSAPRRWIQYKRLSGSPIHVMFLVCDHYEPKHEIKNKGQDIERVKIWKNGYKFFFQRCKNEFGIGPKHTWFYPPHHGLEHLSTLTELAFGGFGEVELHFHHEGDNSEALRFKLKKTIDEYNRRGLLLSRGHQPQTAFGFIHGDWALDNSAGGKYCGVNDELNILQELGCWGDFTMPSANECQTRKINSIYYAEDNPKEPKSHDWGKDVSVGMGPPAGLFMMQGPLGINWFGPGYPRLENACLTTKNWGRMDRIKFWLKCGIHVRGRPEWVFIKLHTHGAIEKDFDALFGERAFQMHHMLNEHCNDKNYQLHYVTAREAYNISKAAEAGCTGNPDDYRDYHIKQHVTSDYFLADKHRLECCTNDDLSISDIRTNKSCNISIGGRLISKISGPMKSVRILNAGKRIEGVSKNVRDQWEFNYVQNMPKLNIKGAELLTESMAGLAHKVVIRPTSETFCILCE